MEPNKQNDEHKPGNVIAPGDNEASESASTSASVGEEKLESQSAVESSNNAEETQKPQPEMDETRGAPSQTPAATGAAGVTASTGGKKGSKKLIFGVLTVVIAMVLIGFGAYAYMEYNKPENRIKRSMGKLLELEQGRFGLEASAARASTSTDMQFSGEVTVDDEKVHGKLMLDKVESGVIGMSSSFQPYIELLYELPEDGKALDELYLKVAGIDKSIVDQAVNSSPSFARVGQEINEFYDTYHDAWIVVEDIQQYIDSASNEETLNYEMTDEDREKLEDILKDAKLFTIEEELGSRDIDGVVADGFEVTPDKEGIVEAVKQIRDADLDVVKKLNKNPATEIDFNEIIENLEEASEASDDTETTVEFWLDGSTLRQVVFDAQDDDMETQMAVTLYGAKSVSIEIPTNAISADQFVQDAQQLYAQFLFGGIGSQAQSSQLNSSQFNSSLNTQPAAPSSVLGAFETR